ncbi:MAG: beta-class carbonic anhydrase [Marmoricola sp.]
MPNDFDDLLQANRSWAADFAHEGTPGVAGAGVAILTCMDSRIDPLALLGLGIGDAKVVRNPGGQASPEAMEALVLAANLLQADRIMVIPHTRCAMGSATLEEMRQRVSDAAGQDASWQPFSVVADQRARLVDDVHRIAAHPLVGAGVKVGGFIYDVDTGLLEQVV